MCITTTRRTSASGICFRSVFKSEPCDANCLDVDNTRRLQDSEVRDFIIEQCGAKSVAEFQRLTMEEQKRQMKQSLEVYIQGVKDEMRAEERMK